MEQFNLGILPARSRSFLASLLAGLVCCWLAEPACAQSGKDMVRIGLVKTMFRDTPDSVVQIAMKPFKALLESSTGYTGQIVPGGDAATLGRKLKEDQVQLAVFHGVEFAWARQKYPTLQPLLIAVNQEPVLHAMLVVRHNCKAASYAGLHGKVVSLPLQTKEHCRLFFERRCVKPGLTPAKFYSEILDPNDVEDALDDVVDGKADATVVDAVAYAAYRKAKPTRAKELRILTESDPFPCAVIAVNSGRFSPEIIHRFRDGLLAARKTSTGLKLFEMIRITGFEVIPENFDTQLTEIAKVYPPPASR